MVTVNYNLVKTAYCDIQSWFHTELGLKDFPHSKLEKCLSGIDHKLSRLVLKRLKKLLKMKIKIKAVKIIT
jgi:hypothetical protein